MKIANEGRVFHYAADFVQWTLYRHLRGRKELDRNGCATRFQTILIRAAVYAVFGGTRAGIPIPRDVPAALGFESNFEVVPLGKNLHSQQVEPPSAGIEIKRPAGGVLQGVGRSEKIFKNQSLIFFRYTDAKIRNHQFRPTFSVEDRDFYPTAVRGVFHGVAD